MVEDGAAVERLSLPDEAVLELAARHGVAYVLDEGVFRRTVRRYRSALAASWGRTDLGYASKANSTLAVLAMAHQEGCLVDVASEGESRAALAAGVPAGRCYLHGNCKSREEVAFAVSAGIGQVVVDNFEEIGLLAEAGVQVPVLLRLAPGVDPVTHAKISTGQDDTKFGFNAGDGSGERAVLAARAAGLDVAGFHCHVGSQLLDPAAQVAGGEVIARFAARMADCHGVDCRVLNVGGGLGVASPGGARPMAIEDYCAAVAAAVGRGLAGSGLEPVLVHEPGRALVSDAGVTVYRVGVVKDVPSREKGTRRFVCVHGGLADNPRPALYGARYEVRGVVGGGRSGGAEVEVTVSGRHCETDKLFVDVFLPEDLRSGDGLEVLGTGAYNSSMSSNYNRYPRPATYLRRETGALELVQREDAWDEMLARESLPEGWSCLS